MRMIHPLLALSLLAGVAGSQEAAQDPAKKAGQEAAKEEEGPPGLFWKMPGPADLYKFTWKFELDFEAHGIFAERIKDERTIQGEFAVQPGTGGKEIVLDLIKIDWRFADTTASVRVIMDDEGVKGKVLRVMTYDEYVRFRKKNNKMPIETKLKYEQASSRHSGLLEKQLRGYIQSFYRLRLEETGAAFVPEDVKTSSPSGNIMGLFDDGFLHDPLPEGGLKEGATLIPKVDGRDIALPYGQLHRQNMEPLKLKVTQRGKELTASGTTKWKFAEKAFNTNGSHSIQHLMTFSPDGHLISSRRAIKHVSHKSKPAGPVKYTVVQTFRIVKE